MDTSTYTGPLTAAELAAWNKRHRPTWTPGATETLDYAAARAEATDASAAYWSAGGSHRQPMAAEAATDEGSDFPRKAKRKRTLHWSVNVPMYCVLVVVFFMLGWLAYAKPSGETARVLGLLIGVPLVLIVAVALLVRWLL